MEILGIKMIEQKKLSRAVILKMRQALMLKYMDLRKRHKQELAELDREQILIQRQCKHKKENLSDPAGGPAMSFCKYCEKQL